RESGDPTDGSLNTLRVKGRFSMVRSRWFPVCGALLSVPCFFFPFPSPSAEEVAMADQPEELETPEVIVSATKTAIPVKEVTSAVEVITGEQMQQRKVRTVAEALGLAQGLAVSQRG